MLKYLKTKVKKFIDDLIGGENLYRYDDPPLSLNHIHLFVSLNTKSMEYSVEHTRISGINDVIDYLVKLSRLEKREETIRFEGKVTELLCTTTGTAVYNFIIGDNSYTLKITVI